MKDEFFVNLSVRGTPALLGLFARARIFQPINRNALFQEAVEYALKAETDWQFLANAALLEYNIRSSEPGPELVQLRLARKKWETILSNINSAFKPDLKRVYASYAIKLVLVNYIIFLEKLNAEKTRKEYLISEIKEIDAPELSLLLTKMILENSAALNDIRAIMIKYKRGDYDR